MNTARVTRCFCNKLKYFPKNETKFFCFVYTTKKSFLKNALKIVLHSTTKRMTTQIILRTKKNGGRVYNTHNRKLVNDKIKEFR